IAGLPSVMAITFSFRLMEMACQDSYPLNSENASPPGTFTLYLSCADMARLPRRAIHTVAIPIVNLLIRFIAASPESRVASHNEHTHDTRSHESRQLDDGIGPYLRMDLAASHETRSGDTDDDRYQGLIDVPDAMADAVDRDAANCTSSQVSHARV